MSVPDYSQYTFRQLYEALDSVRGDLYPKIMSALEAEIRRRRDVPKPDLEEAYFLLDHDKHPEHREHLARMIATQGGFDTIAPELVNDENRYHTGWRRFWALIFDTLIGMLVLGVCTLPILRQADGDVVITSFVNIASQLVMLWYFILMHAAYGQTLGKMITGVKVVRNSDEAPISFLRALLRDLVPLVLLAAAVFMLPQSDIIVATDKASSLKPPAMVGAISMVGLLWGVIEVLSFLFSKKRRALHDFIAGTVVIRYLRLQPAGNHGRSSLTHMSNPAHDKP